MVTSHVQDFNGRDLSYLSTVQSEEYTAEPAIAGCLKCCFQRQSVHTCQPLCTPDRIYSLQKRHERVIPVVTETYLQTKNTWRAVYSGSTETRTLAP